MIDRHAPGQINEPGSHGLRRKVAHELPALCGHDDGDVKPDLGDFQHVVVVRQLLHCLLAMLRPQRLLHDCQRMPAVTEVA